jgi:ABC-type oligopeptide transport system substrate-binding subunit
VHKPSLLAFGALVAGMCLIVAATTGSATGRLRQGGTLRVNLPVTDIDDIDPSLAYGSVSWHIEYSTALKLLNYPDASGPRGSRLVPEGASSVAVSPDGRTYTFRIRKGFRFSDGTKVTARNYAFAINRALGKDLQSPAFQFVADPNGVNIVGAQAVRDGTAVKASGVRVRGSNLTIKLTGPDGSFLAKISMPFFQALPTSLSRTDKVIEVDSGHRLPSAGPYFVSERVPNELVTLRKNPNYAKAVVRKYTRRPAHLSQIDIKTVVNLDASYEAVRANRDDYTYSLPRGVGESLGEEFGLRGRFRVRPTNCINFVAMNSGGTGAGAALFRNNPSLRRAVNYVIDREAMVELSPKYTVVPHDQYLPRGFPGFKDINAYPFRPDVAKARELAEGHVPSGGPWKYYYGLAAPGPRRMELVRSNLAQIGVQIDPQGFRGFAIYDAAGKRNSPHAFVTVGWCQQSSDPSTFINTLFYGGNDNDNIAHFNDPAYNRRMERAARLTGDARLRAYTRLEHDLVTKAAPLAAWGQPANQFFFSDSVDTRSFVYQPIYEAPPYNLLALK